MILSRWTFRRRWVDTWGISYTAWPYAHDENSLTAVQIIRSGNSLVPHSFVTALCKALLEPKKLNGLLIPRRFRFYDPRFSHECCQSASLEHTPSTSQTLKFGVGLSVPIFFGVVLFALFLSFHNPNLQMATHQLGLIGLLLFGGYVVFGFMLWRQMKRHLPTAEHTRGEQMIKALQSLGYTAFHEMPWPQFERQHRVDLTPGLARLIERSIHGLPLEHKHHAIVLFPVCRQGTETNQALYSEGPILVAVSPCPITQQHRAYVALVYPIRPILVDEPS